MFFAVLPIRAPDRIKVITCTVYSIDLLFPPSFIPESVERYNTGAQLVRKTEAEINEKCREGFHLQAT